MLMDSRTHQISRKSQLGDGRTPGESIYALISGHWVHICQGLESKREPSVDRVVGVGVTVE